MNIGLELSNKIIAHELSLEPVDNRRLMNLCGQVDEHLRQIEKRLGVEINTRGAVFQILGGKFAVHLAQDLILKLYSMTEKEELTPSKVHLFVQEAAQELKLHKKPKSSLPKIGHHNNGNEGVGVIKTPNEAISARSENQLRYLSNIHTHDVSFGIGPAGTGKTYLAVACAIAALESHKVKRILLVRPAVEAGERLGFLPGDLSQKIDPYLRPLYDALYEMLGFESVNKLIERHIIELAPLAYMRGRTLNDSFIILDEAQNTTREQMKMFLTRLGFGSTSVITGDVTQVDLPHGVMSGLKHAIQVFHNTVPEISFTFFESMDIVRHSIVQKIVEAYDRYGDPLKPKGNP